MKPLCIYHGNCADGFAAAWVFRKRFGDGIDFHPGVYQQPPPPIAGRKVFMTDFSYKRPIVEGMLAEAESVTLIDHHKTALEDLQGVLGMEHCALDRSGAMLAWNFCFPDEEPPQLLRHIEDRDLWLFKLPKTREIQAALFSYPYDFVVWDKLLATPTEELALQGEAIERKHFKDIDELLGVTQRRMVIGGYNVPIANLPYTLVSDAAHKMAKGEPFAGCYWDTPKGRVFGLRSTDAGVDVSEVAKQYGGGGHRNASGFTVPFSLAAGFEL
jgi:oligoribonuclease NrnB/cAMP/cGMP phosphodiesterase (DHH superfamily)